ncbi:tRNA (N(6)-L-threonylcarbamoyladenosine(37)-C(2))-methylthiotransferase MtaB [Natranaerofaba carboxydovora]|uniref:tRNA (N(6)-L-threonylcarbamoyladenosine(37)-C(2))- methylthiotransferase MtaB n=1 Tax=Natranaerofaba carboxydovora TaxID=2742683 RepID=UPI001F134477|nr:tRNA (N(6)-L-threonylcarbamoyladenosine(37)-C(2))-methylthiotransferase MtaB [Natranaerofaba carboxydovora]UMZ74029.1 Threonylcarbamoyladenosine tRNA methylthiotransferase MtaB [Natranaerofaba carboxydovora]
MNKRELKYKIMTVGCPVNQAETEALKTKFDQIGVVETESEYNNADVYIINSCAVTQAAARKSRKKAKKAKKDNPEAIVALMGCYGEVEPDEIKEKVPEIDIVIGTNGRTKLVNKVIDLISAKLEQKEVFDFDSGIEDISVKISEKSSKSSDFEELGIYNKSVRKRPVVKIQEGCNQVCSFCIVTIARGKPKSRLLENIEKEIKNLVASGHKEIILAGTNMGLYGKDFEDRITLSELLYRLSSKEKDLQKDFRIRLSSLEPIEITEDVLYAIKESKKICKHLYLPLQSGSDRILELMKRNYSIDEFSRIVEKARKLMPDISIISDIIVGFPDESEKDHQESMKVIESLGLDKLHVFPYSPRPKTPAEKYSGHVRPDIKDRRVDEMKRLGEKLNFNFHQRQVGKDMEVLMERYHKEKDDFENISYWLEGFSNNYAYVKAELKTPSIPNEYEYGKYIEKNFINNIITAKATNADKDIVTAWM